MYFKFYGKLKNVAYSTLAKKFLHKVQNTECWSEQMSYN